MAKILSVLALAAGSSALSASVAARVGSTPYERLAGVSLASVPGGEPVALGALWRRDERVVVEFLRHFG